MVRTTSFYCSFENFAEIATFIVVGNSEKWYLNKYFIAIEQYILPKSNSKRNYPYHWGVKSKFSYSQFCNIFQGRLVYPTKPDEAFMAIQNKAINSSDFVDTGVDLLS